MNQLKGAKRGLKLHKGLKIAGIAIAGLVLALVILVKEISPLSHRWVVEALSEHYHSRVQLKSFEASLFPRVRIAGAGLVLRYRNRPGTPPLISVDSFTAHTSWLALLRHPTRVNYVRLQGLRINIAPRVNKQAPAKSRRHHHHHLVGFVLGEVDADGAVLTISSSNPQKPPRVFTISKLRLHSAGPKQAMSFQAILTNPKPLGQIRSGGKFGPWDADDPSRTPVSGTYSFDHADLSTIRGLDGMLSSEGKYTGVLSFIKVDGNTDTPDFALGISGHPVDLKANFHAIVDGVNGDTLLRPVNVQFLQSSLQARGGVLRTTGGKGSTVVLDLTSDHARIENLLWLAVKSPKPMLTGGVVLRVKFDLPPSHQDIAKRMGLADDFEIQSGQFTNPNLEHKLTSLSRRGQGEHGGSESSNAVFNIKGRFALNQGTMTFRELSFEVPGAAVDIHGTYALLGGALDFRGQLRLKAKLSQITTGKKSLFLKMLDPLFAGHGAGTVIPIRITGTREHVSFTVDVHKMLHRLKP